jgi:hypothetical protein
MTQPVLVTPMPQGNARVKKLLAVALVVLVAALLLPKLLLGGGGGDSAALADGVAATGGTPATSVPSAADASSPPIHATTDKDPFKALRATTAAAGGDTAPTASVAAAVPAAPIPSPIPAVTAPVGVPAASDPFPMLTLPTTNPTPTTPTTPTTVPSGVQAGPVPVPVPAAIRTVSLDSVWIDGTGLLAATVRVDDTTYAVAQGQDFGFSYRLLSLDRDSSCGVFLYGDKRFSLCQGEQTRT